MLQVGGAPGLIYLSALVDSRVCLVISAGNVSLQNRSLDQLNCGAIFCRARFRAALYFNLGIFVNIRKLIEAHAPSYLVNDSTLIKNPQKLSKQKIPMKTFISILVSLS